MGRITELALNNSFMLMWRQGTDDFGCGVRPECPVILPVLTGHDRRTHAAIFSFMAGVTPPIPMLGRSLL
jgi:hypothetical protein